MFEQYAARAAALSNNNTVHNFTIKYRESFKEGNPKFVIVKAKDQDSAKRIFENNHPTAKILFINQ